ncbi:Uncharacterised protein [Streptococcus pneumoniae]|nr:Uncharacterised protein [Streptococcus pneumoniae]
MYKKLHKAEIVISSGSLSTKGSFFGCVPEISEDVSFNLFLSTLSTLG